MTKMKLLIALLFAAAPLLASEGLVISVEPLGDAADGVVVRTTFRFTVGSDVPPGIPLVIQGSVMQGGVVTKRFRLPLQESQRETLSTIQTLQAGDAEIEARLMVPLEEQAPVIVAKTATKFTIGKTNKTYVAGEGAGAEAVIAEGVVPEGAGAVRILPPRRDVAVTMPRRDVAAQRLRRAPTARRTDGAVNHEPLDPADPTRTIPSTQT